MNCEHTQTGFQLRFFANARYNSSDVRAPKWAFHVAKICTGCGKHLGFVEQTPELVKELNGRLLIKNFLEGCNEGGL